MGGVGGLNLFLQKSAAQAQPPTIGAAAGGLGGLGGMMPVEGEKKAPTGFGLGGLGGPKVGGLTGLGGIGTGSGEAKLGGLTGMGEEKKGEEEKSGIMEENVGAEKKPKEGYNPLQEEKKDPMTISLEVFYIIIIIFLLLFFCIKITFFSHRTSVLKSKDQAFSSHQEELTQK